MYKLILHGIGYKFLNGKFGRFLIKTYEES